MVEPVQVSDVPIISAAKKVHQNVFNFVKSALAVKPNSGGTTQNQNMNKKMDNETDHTSSTDSIHNTLVQSYRDAAKNIIHHTHDAVTKLRSSIRNELKKSIKNNYPPNSTTQNVKTSQEKNSNNMGHTDITTHQQRSAEHLKALRNVIALQLVNYNGNSSSPSTEVPVMQKNEPNNAKGSEMNKKNISKKRHVIYDSSNRDLTKKLAVIAAAKALMEILDA